MLRLYRSLLALYPCPYRREFAEEMLAVLGQLEHEASQVKLWARVTIRAREASGLLYGAAAQHARQITGFSGSPAFSPRRSRMRSEFRFPKATPILMTIILVAVIMAIEKAKAISAAVPPSSTPVPPIPPEHFSTVTTFGVILAMALAAAAIAWLVVYTLRRSGVQRFSEVHPGINAARK